MPTSATRTARATRGALGFALKLDLPGHLGMHPGAGCRLGQLGERGAAKSPAGPAQVRPDFGAIPSGILEQWWIGEYTELLIEGWRKAGLEITPASAAVTRP